MGGYTTYNVSVTYRSGIAATGPPSPPHGAANAQADTQRCHAMCVKFLSDFQLKALQVEKN